MLCLHAQCSLTLCSLQKIERKRELGIPIDTEAEDLLSSSDNEDGHAVDPDERLEMHHKDHQMAWSYSGYMNALKDERVLSEIDDTDFSSLSSKRVENGRFRLVN